MPLYTFECQICAARVVGFRRMVARDRPETHCGVLAPRTFDAPAVRGDLPGYRSPTTDQWIEGRRARQEDLRRSNCRPYEPGEKEQMVSRKQQSEQRFDRALDATVEREVVMMPESKRTRLFNEVAAGATAEITRH